MQKNLKGSASQKIRQASQSPFGAGTKRSSRDGQLLIESLIAVSLLITGFLGIFSLLSRSLSLNRAAADNYTATYLAAEGIEVVRGIVDANAMQKNPWNSGLTSCPCEVQYNNNDSGRDNPFSLVPDQKRTLSFDSGSNVYSYTGASQTNFKRVVEINSVNKYEIRVNSIVSWTTLGSGSYQVNLEDHFFNWKF